MITIPPGFNRLLHKATKRAASGTMSGERLDWMIARADARAKATDRFVAVIIGIVIATALAGITFALQ